MHDVAGALLTTMPLEARDNAFYLDGKKVQLLSGAIHYFRVVPEYWEDRLRRLKACGLNCVETQVFSSSCHWVVVDNESFACSEPYAHECDR